MLNVDGFIVLGAKFEISSHSDLLQKGTSRQRQNSSVVVLFVLCLGV